MSWADDAKKRYDSARQDAEQKRLSKDVEIANQSAELRQLMDRYNEVISKGLKSVGDAIWGHSVFFPSYKIFYNKEVHILENDSLLGRADWYVYSKTKTIELSMYKVVLEGWHITLLHTNKTVLREGIHGLYQTDITLQTVEDKFQELMSRCIERGPEGINPLPA